MPPPSSAAYPAAGAVFGIGPKANILQDMTQGYNGWGSGCSDFGVEECSTDLDCPSQFFCLLPAKVCMQVDFKTGVRCYRHDMCQQGFMCDGTGTCVQPFVVYLNNATQTMEAVMYTEQCDYNSDTYHTDGASPWEYVPDWLTGHCLCSNNNWYYYSLDLIELGT